MKFCSVCGGFYPDDEALTTCPEDGAPLRDIHGAEDDAWSRLVGKTVDGRFRVEEVLGHGGMGAVYRAIQLSVGREVALKVILGQRNEAALRRFLREARTTSMLRNVHTVTIYDFGVHEGAVPYLAMELLEGQDLRRQITTQGPKGWRQALHIVEQVAASLHEAHEAGIVHRDMKSENIFLTRMGNDPDFVKVLDFGIAKVEGADSQLTATGTVVGTPQYLAPEQAMGKPLDGRTDLYSLGIVLFEMLAGRVPFLDESAMAMMLAHTTEPVPPVTRFNPSAEVPAGVQALLDQLLQKAPERRIQTAGQLQELCHSLLKQDGLLTADIQPSTRILPASQLNGNEPQKLEPFEQPGRNGRLQLETQATIALSPDANRRAKQLAVLAAVMLVGVGGTLLATRERDAPAPAVTAEAKAPAAPASTASSAARAGASPPTSSGRSSSEANRQRPGGSARVLGGRDALADDATSHAARPGGASRVEAVVPGRAADATTKPATVDKPEAAIEPKAAHGVNATPAPGVTSAPDGAPSRAVAAKVVTIRSSPVEGVKITDTEGRRLGKTPWTMASPARPLRLTLRARGYRPARLTVQAGAVGDLVVSLRKRASPKRGKKGSGGGVDLLEF